MRDRIVSGGVTINGLPLFGDTRVHDLDVYYRVNVIGGPGAFMIVAERFATFATTLKRKLVLEIAEGEPVDRGAERVDKPFSLTAFPELTMR